MGRGGKFVFLGGIAWVRLIHSQITTWAAFVTVSIFTFNCYCWGKVLMGFQYGTGYDLMGWHGAMLSCRLQLWMGQNRANVSSW